MELLKFKEYLINQVNEYLNQLKNLDNEISSLPEPPNFDLTKYGTKKYFLKKYYESKSKHIFSFKLKIKPTFYALELFARTLVLNALEAQKKALEEQIAELQNSISKINEEGIVAEIYPLKNTLNALLDYCVQNKIPASAFLKYFSKIIRNVTPEKDVVPKTILNNIAIYFDEEGELYPNFQSDTLIFILKKIFTLLELNKSEPEYKAYISSLYTYIKSIAVNKPLSKSELATQKANLAKLNSYIKGNTIIRIPENMDDFLTLLLSSGLRAEQISFIKNKMINAINTSKAQAEENKLAEVIAKYLSDYDKKTIYEAEQLMLNSSDVETNALISRLRDDVMSLCRYLIIVEGSNEEQETIDFITQKINALRILIRNAKDATFPKTNTFYYLIDNNHLPKLTHIIETIDITFYEEIYNLLTDLGNNLTVGTKIDEINGIEIYKLLGNNVKIIYAKQNNEIVITSISILSIVNEKDSMINNEIIESLKLIYASHRDEAFQKLHAIYESLIASQLDLSKMNPNLTFHSRHE